MADAAGVKVASSPHGLVNALLKLSKASPEDIDRAWMGVMRVPVGPFGVMDQVGLKTVWTILDFWAKALNDQQATANANFVKQYVDKGRLGAKTKQGFYTYPNPAYTRADFLSGGK